MEIGAVPGDRFAGRANSLAALVIAVVVLRHHREQLCFVLQPARDRVFEGVKLFRIAVLCQIADHKHSVERVVDRVLLGDGIGLVEHFGNALRPHVAFSGDMGIAGRDKAQNGRKARFVVRCGRGKQDRAEQTQYTQDNCK